jgi:integrase
MARFGSRRSAFVAAHQGSGCEDRFLREGLAAQSLHAARNREERLLLMFALHTGARAGEQLAIEWGDVDWRNNFVVFRRSSTRGIVDHTKSGRERRVPLTSGLRAELRAHRHVRSKLVFCNADGRMTEPKSLGTLSDSEASAGVPSGI